MTEPVAPGAHVVGEPWDGEALARVLQDIYLELSKKLDALNGRLASLETLIRDQRKH